MSRHIPRVFVDQPLDCDQQIELLDDTAHHLNTVLRIRRGDHVRLFNGYGGEYLAEVTQHNRHQISVFIREFVDTDRESPLRILLAQGIARGERMDFAIQKAVEMGVDAIQPLHTAKSQRLPAERLERKWRHWQAVARSAAEQSGRTRLPEVREPLALGDWLSGAAQDYPPDERLLLAPDAGNSVSVAAPHARACLLIGPEAGLDDGEIALALERGFTAIRLGPRTLRTETAGMAAITALQLLWGDLGV